MLNNNIYNYLLYFNIVRFGIQLYILYNIIYNIINVFEIINKIVFQIVYFNTNTSIAIYNLFY